MVIGNSFTKKCDLTLCLNLFYCNAVPMKDRVQGSYMTKIEGGKYFSTVSES